MTTPPSAPPSLSGEDARLIERLRDSMNHMRRMTAGGHAPWVSVQPDDVERILELLASCVPSLPPLLPPMPTFAEAVTAMQTDGNNPADPSNPEAPPYWYVPCPDDAVVMTEDGDILGVASAWLLEKFAFFARVPSLSTSGAAEPEDALTCNQPLNVWRRLADCYRRMQQYGQTRAPLVLLSNEAGYFVKLAHRLERVGDAFGPEYNAGAREFWESAAPSLEPTRAALPRIPASAIILGPGFYKETHGGFEWVWSEQRTDDEGEESEIAAIVIRADAVEVVPAPSPATQQEPTAGEPGLRAGDTVHHEPTGEDWIVADVDYERGELMWCGWPEGIAKIADCVLVTACTDELHTRTLTEIAAGQGLRASRARHLLFHGKPGAPSPATEGR